MNPEFVWDQRSRCSPRINNDRPPHAPSSEGRLFPPEQSLGWPIDPLIANILASYHSFKSPLCLTEILLLPYAAQKRQNPAHELPENDLSRRNNSNRVTGAGRGL